MEGGSKKERQQREGEGGVIEGGRGDGGRELEGEVMKGGRERER